jgi:acylphosphatase
MSSIARVHVIAEGLVQGVGYRYFVMETAHSLGLVGWVRNLRDGRVEADIEGDESTIQEMLKTMKQGPASAHVKTLQTETLNELVGHTNFRVTPDA